MAEAEIIRLQSIVENGGFDEAASAAQQELYDEADDVLAPLSNAGRPSERGSDDRVRQQGMKWMDSSLVGRTRGERSDTTYSEWDEGAGVGRDPTERVSTITRL